MNELFCPGCGASVCDFVIYCPECGFALQEYLKKQKRQASDTFFSDIMPVSSEKEQEENSLPKENNTVLKMSKQKKGTWIAAVCALLLLTAVVMVFMFQNQGTSGRDSQRIHAPVITHSWYDENNNHITRLESDVKEPFAAVYTNRKDDLSCVYFIDGVGEYLGGDLSQPIGSLPVDSSVQIDSINTFYQRYVESESDSLYVLNFDIVFNQNVDGLFMYDIYCAMDQPLYSSVSSYQYCFSGAVSVRGGQCRVIEKVDDVPTEVTVKAQLTPKGFVRTDGSFMTETKRLWGGQVKFVDFSNYSTAFCEQIYSIDESRYDPKNSILLYRYTLESGGNEKERGKSTYYYRLTETYNRTDISHAQDFYGITDVSKPTYSLDIFGVLSVAPFLE